jgi:hypothetical protein
MYVSISSRRSALMSSLVCHALYRIYVILRSFLAIRKDDALVARREELDTIVLLAADLPAGAATRCARVDDLGVKDENYGDGRLEHVYVPSQAR